MGKQENIIIAFRIAVFPKNGANWQIKDNGCLKESEETVRELMDLLTERQRQMLQRIYFQQKTQKEVSHELGITVPAVSKCISQAMQKMRNNSDGSARELEKGDWKYAW